MLHRGNQNAHLVHGTDAADLLTAAFVFLRKRRNSLVALGFH
jgi:hypothetical protein